MLLAWLSDMTALGVQVGGAVHGIMLWPLGGLAFVGHAGSPGRDLYVAICGPLTHIPQAPAPSLAARLYAQCARQVLRL